MIPAIFMLIVPMTPMMPGVQPEGFELLSNVYHT